MGCFLSGALSWSAGQNRTDSGDPVALLRMVVEQATGSDRLFINGTLYQDAYPRTDGHPFLGDGLWTEGSVRSGGDTYRGLLLRYDMYRDLLIYHLIREEGTYGVILNGETIDWFSMSGRRFIHIREPATAVEGKRTSLAEPGFYEEICTGNASLYVKRIKQYDPPSTASGRFTAVDHVYILKGGVLQRINGRRGLLRVLNDHEKPVKQFIRDHQVILRGGRVEGYRQVVDHYNSLQP